MKPFDYYINQCAISDTRAFTKVLKSLEGERGGRWIKISKTDAEYIFHNCLVMFVDAPKEVQFNAMRLVRYCLANEDFLKQYYSDVWQFYTLSVFHPDGNVRNAGFWFYSEFLFQVSCLLEYSGLFRKRQPKLNKGDHKKLEEFYVFSGMSLFQIHNDYIEDNKKRLSKKEKGDGKYIPFVTDTKDPYLRTIRRAIEDLTRGTLFDRLAEKYGFKKIH